MDLQADEGQELEQLRARVAELESALRSYESKEEALRQQKEAAEERKVRERTEHLTASNLRLAREVEERARTEHALESNRRHLQSILDGMTAFVLLASPQGEVLEANRALLDAAGLAREDVLGRKLTETPWWADSAEAQAQLDEGLRLAGAGDSIRFDLGVRFGDRSGTLDATFAPLWEDGQVRQVVLSGVDVTERRRIEQALKRSEQSLAEAQRIARLGNWDWGIIEGTLHWSAEIYRLFGLPKTKESTTYEAFLQSVHPEDRPKVEEGVALALDDHKPYDILHRIQRPDGTERTVRERAEVIRDGAGKPQRMIGTVQDVTEQVRMEAELATLLERERKAREEAERASRAKDVFLALVSHELKTPLTSMLLRVQALRRGEVEEARVRQGLDRIEATALVQKQLIDDLLDVSSLMAEKLTLRLEELEPVQEVQQAVEGLRDAAEKKGLQIDLLCEPIPGVLRADRLRLNQVLWNLLNNAIKFTPKGGRVEVRLVPVEGPGGAKMARIEVLDSGEGMDLEFLPRVFESFTQADISTRRRHGGLGLGMAIARNLVELHGGTIRAHSDGKGLGSRFTVELPLHRR